MPRRPPRAWLRAAPDPRAVDRLGEAVRSRDGFRGGKAAIRFRLPTPLYALLDVIPLLALAPTPAPPPCGDQLTVPRTALRVPHAAPRLRTDGDALRAHDPHRRLLGRGRPAVVTPRLCAAHRIADGDLRTCCPRATAAASSPDVPYITPSRSSSPGPAPAAWTAQLVALDDLGRIAPRRGPLGSEVPDEDDPGDGRPRLEHPDPEKVLAQPR